MTRILYSSIITLSRYRTVTHTAEPCEMRSTPIQTRPSLQYACTAALIPRCPLPSQPNDALAPPHATASAPASASASSASSGENVSEKTSAPYCVPSLDRWRSGWMGEWLGGWVGGWVDDGWVEVDGLTGLVGGVLGGYFSHLGAA